jgi:predicted phage terminase large subunit-like protein
VSPRSSTAQRRRCHSCHLELPDGSDPRVPARFTVCKGCGWEANVGPQSRFLACTAYEALYGGAAGGGKTEALVMAPLRWVDTRGFRALILRRTFKELNRDIVPLMFEHYPTVGGKPHISDATWRFPSGAVIEYGHVEHESDVHQYQGLEVQYLAFDELTTFTEKQYTYLLSRVRSTNVVPPRVRAATNPGGEGHDWVMKRWAPWLDRRDGYQGVRAEPGKLLYYRNADDGEMWTARGVDTLSRVFIPARLQDNPHLTANDPDYAARLGGLDPVTRAQLRDGDWLAMPRAGAYYRREWFRWIDVKPARVVLTCRRWDLASTTDGDWTVGARMSLLHDGTVVLEDVVRARLRPDGVEKLVLSTAQLDGKAVHVVLPEDPGQAGKAQVSAFSRQLIGYVVRSVRETGDKVTRQEPFSAQCEAGNVAMLKAAWNGPVMQSLEAFPTKGIHDDDVDACAGGYTYLADRMPSLAYLRGVEEMAKGMRP